MIERTHKQHHVCALVALAEFSSIPKFRGEVGTFGRSLRRLLGVERDRVDQVDVVAPAGQP